MAGKQHNYMKFLFLLLAFNAGRIDLHRLVARTVLLLFWCYVTSDRASTRRQRSVKVELQLLNFILTISRFRRSPAKI